MSLSDYVAQWNEEAARVWWEEEGKHPYEPDVLDPEDEQRAYGAEDAFYGELDEQSNDELLAMLHDDDYCYRWPQAMRAIRNVLADRGVEVA